MKTLIILALVFFMLACSDGTVQSIGETRLDLGYDLVIFDETGA
ncbi:MAG: hypothetical protein QNJ97_04050 [Myxococcota bacterium]|nr:hypothetical protein [Myxococcota bacterium]